MPDSLTAIDDNPFVGTKAELSLSADHPHFTLVDGMLIDKGEKQIVSHSHGSLAKKCVVPEGILHIGNNAFYRCDSLTGITLPEGLQSIGVRAFYECEGLAGIKLPEGFKRIENEAFYGCSSLGGIALPDSLTAMGDNPFAKTKAKLSLSPDHPHFALVDGMLIDKGKKRLVSHSCGSLAETCAVPEGTQHIGASAFYSCDCLTGIRLPEGLQSIKKQAFMDAKAWLISRFRRVCSISDTVRLTGAKADRYRAAGRLQHRELGFSDCNSLTTSRCRRVCST